jgi:CubicO group peptidase (beta-lactamase class C family)
MTPGSQAVNAGVDASALARLDASVQADIDAGLHTGASYLVARGGKVVHRVNVGTVAPHRPAASDDRYMLMSMTKAYTAVLALRAIDQGLFGLETRVDEVLPGFKAHGKQDATIRQLLCHTAGLPTAPVAPPLPMSAAGQLARHAKAICDLRPVYPAGTRCAYTSGTGYDALGQILVNTDTKRRSFQRIAQEELFGPLGMTNTSYGLAVDDPKRVPVAWTPMNEGPMSPIQGRTFNALGADAEYPCAGAFGTVDDVYLFIEALVGRAPGGVTLLSPALFDEARKNQTGDLKFEAILYDDRIAMLRQLVGTVGLIKAFGIAQAMLGSRLTDELAHNAYPANFTLLGGYVRGTGDHFAAAGRTASRGALSAAGYGTTGWMFDPERDLTFIFLSAGVVEGFAHPLRLERLCDLAIAAVRN